MNIHQKTDQLFLIDLDQEIEGFRQFISSWVYRKHGKSIIVDPGPAITIPVLVKALLDLGVQKIDYILLTHIHIDHAGGTGLLAARFPKAEIICHTAGIPHMINPDRLWQGSLNVLGDIAKAYGPIAAIQEEAISFTDKIEHDTLKIEIFKTPGHASHHLNYLIDGILFAGEVAGVNVPMKDAFYLRIATPPKFIYEVYKDSLYKAANFNCDKICFGHYDLRHDVRNVFDQAKAQLELWMETVRKNYEENNNINASQIFNDLIESDPSIKSFKKLEKDIQKREEYFAINSINGMLGYLKR